MSRNKNVGRNAIADAGLVLQAKPEIDRTESGMLQTTLRFHLRNEKYPELDPVRTTPCNEFTAGDSRTTAILAALNYIGSQTSKFIRSGFAPGIGILDVLCQGAIFNQGEAVESVQHVLFSDRGTNYTIAPNVVFTSPAEVNPASAYARLHRKDNSISAPGTGYVVGDIITFVGGTFDLVHMQRVTEVDGSGGIVASVVHQYSEYIIVPSNPVSVSGGTGTGAQFTVIWELGVIHVTDGGNYKGTIPPVVSLPLAAAETPGSAVASMGPPHYTDNLLFTTPFDPITTVKDTVELIVYGASAAPAVLQARLTTNSLPGYSHAITFLGEDLIYGTPAGTPFPVIDGRTVNVGDRILLRDESAFAGLYRVTDLGSPTTSWFLTRVAEMDESAEVTSSVYVQIAEGDIGAGTTWQCTVSGPFTIDADPITFVPFVATSTYVPLYRVTIDYRAIELNFDYMAAVKQPDPRFVRDEYQLDANHRIIINPSTGEVFGLKIDEVTAIQLNVITDPISSNVTITDGPQVAIDESVWRPWVKYVGTAAQFQQVPAGQYWHVTETATVKMVPIPATGSIVGP